jgi:hypothetical protein
VLPGSGLKGAVRTVFELLSFSCDPLAQGHCRPDVCCEACSLFGLLGWSGRVSFGDAVPVGAVEVATAKVPVPWKPDAASTKGEFRFYDFDDAREPAREPASGPRDRRPGTARPVRPKVLVREVFRGEFETRMTFWNLTAVELGRLLLSLGVGSDSGSDPSVRFLLRVGGAKYDGKGAVAVTPSRFLLRHPARESVEAEACRARAAPWITAARESAWGLTFWPTLQALAAVLGGQP